MLSVTIARGDDLFEVEAESSSTVIELKQRLAPDCGVAAGAQIIVRGGRVLRDGDTLDAAGVADGSELHLVAAKAPEAASSSSAPASPPLPPSPPPGPPSEPEAEPLEKAVAIIRRIGGMTQAELDEELPILESALTSAMSDPKDEVRTAAASAFL